MSVESVARPQSPVFALDIVAIFALAGDDVH
jgi:hypothetical protein